MKISAGYEEVIKKLSSQIVVKNYGNLGARRPGSHQKEDHLSKRYENIFFGHMRSPPLHVNTKFIRAHLGSAIAKPK